MVDTQFWIFIAYPFSRATRNINTYNLVDYLYDLCKNILLNYGYLITFYILLFIKLFCVFPLEKLKSQKLLNLIMIFIIFKKKKITIIIGSNNDKQIN